MDQGVSLSAEPQPPRPPETLATARLVLRPLGLGDAPDIYRYGRDAQATRFMVWETHRDIAAAETFAQRCARCWEAGPAFPWAITLGAGGELIGSIELHVHPPKADFGYILRREFWGRGFASEAARAVVNWAIAQPAIYRVWAVCNPDNVASARVLEKAGLRFEARLAAWEPLPNLGEPAGDALVYARTRPTS